ncbi:hypothetical protein BU16DRAFT_596089 [Lophium mytilinum]|uniref:Cytochrome b561 domain-containing protein n=1 Tax=Lophium mytilinum TaxID=390894 RepID=A0A6A6QD30_9PEZI|nr:hypothetical protein BU16DRAFT_596089 [Lophium mytilinum]
MASRIIPLVLLLTSTTNAYGDYGAGGGYSNNGGGYNPSSYNSSFLTSGTKILTAHAVLAAVAFVILFPTGGILIRVASFPGLWLIHGLFQIFAYVVYIAAFGLGIYLAQNLHMMDQTHAIIGMVLFVVLLFQPVLGMLHHIGFKKNTRRGVWSYVHIWLGRGLITLGIVNGGLGLKLAKDMGIGKPTNGQVIAYVVMAALMWGVYMLAAVFGEVKRGRDGGDSAEKETASLNDDAAPSRGSRRTHGSSIYG